MRFKFGGKKRALNQLEIARANFNAAHSAFERAVSLCDELSADPMPRELEVERMEGWLQAINAVAATPLLNEHESVRAAIIGELERRLHAYCDRPMESATP